MVQICHSICNRRVEACNDFFYRIRKAIVVTINDSLEFVGSDIESSVDDSGEIISALFKKKNAVTGEFPFCPSRPSVDYVE